jgi:hypothetical protein
MLHPEYTTKKAFYIAGYSTDSINNPACSLSALRFGLKGPRPPSERKAQYSQNLLLLLFLSIPYTVIMKRYFLVILLLFFFLAPGRFFAQEREYPPVAIINAAYRGDPEMVKKILATNPDPDVRNGFGATALHEAIWLSSLEVIKLLLDYGFDVNAVVASNGYTPLHYTVWLNKPEAVRLLVQYKADKNIKDKQGLTPLEKARKEGKRDLILALSRK